MLILNESISHDEWFVWGNNLEKVGGICTQIWTHMATLLPPFCHKWSLGEKCMRLSVYTCVVYVCVYTWKPQTHTFLSNRSRSSSISFSLFLNHSFKYWTKFGRRVNISISYIIMRGIGESESEFLIKVEILQHPNGTRRKRIWDGQKERGPYLHTHTCTHTFIQCIIQPLCIPFSVHL